MENLLNKKFLQFFISVFLFTWNFLSAQQHPIEVEYPTILEEGHAKSEIRFSHFRNQPFPLSGLEGNLTKIGSLFFACTYDGFVELQFDGTLLDYLQITHRRTAFNSTITTTNSVTGDIGDFMFWTKFKILNEYTHGVSYSIRFGVQLPNTSNESGLGVDEMNFYSSFLFQKHFAGLWTLNLGLAILGDPASLSAQHDMMIYAAEYSLPIFSETTVLLQTAGRFGHEGTGVHRLANAKIGFEQRFGKLYLRCNAVSNFAPSDNAKGIELGFGYVTRIFSVFR